VKLSRIIPLAVLTLLLPVAFFTAAAVAAHQTYCGDAEFDDWESDIDWMDDEDYPIMFETAEDLLDRSGLNGLVAQERYYQASNEDWYDDDYYDKAHPAGNYD
jgi:hypothetical protein